MKNGLTLKSRELLERPESLLNHNVTGNGKRDGQKIAGLGNQQPSTFKMVKVQRLAARRTPKWVEVREGLNP